MRKPRKQKLVDHETQSSLVIQLCLHWSLFVVANVLVLSFWLNMLHVPGELSQSQHQFLDILIPFLLVSVVLLPIFVLDSVRLSNRIIGPILRLRSKLQEMKNGKNNSPLSFRENDFWQALAEDFNLAFPAEKVEAATNSSAPQAK